MKFTSTNFNNSIAAIAFAAFFVNSSMTGVQGMANPASVCCGQKGGKSEIVNSRNGQYGVCVKGDEKVEEWLFYDNNCKSEQLAITCCEDKGGKYETVAGKNGDFGICRLGKNQSYDAMDFMEEHCPPDTKYKVYANNNCDGDIVQADFDLGDNSRSVSVTLGSGDCTFVGGTDEDTVHYTSTGSYVSGGSDFCGAESENNSCNMRGMADNACVVNLC